MNFIKYAVGDVRNHPRTKSTVIIPHCCNDIPAMGSGVAKALYMKWPAVRESYMTMRQHELGSVDCVDVSGDGTTLVYNMIGQHKVRVGFNDDGVAIGPDGKPPIRYDKLSKAMLEIVSEVKFEFPDGDVEFHCPLFGCDLAGGEWNVVSEMINFHWAWQFPVTCIIHESSLEKFGYLLEE